MKRLLICLLCCLLLCTAALAAEPAITSLKTDCVVTGSGDAEFTQTVSIQLDTPVNELQFPLGARTACENTLWRLIQNLTHLRCYKKLFKLFNRF